jgi:inorganic pyrophosphatase
MFGLRSQNKYIRKVLALEVNEADELGINSIEDYRRQNPGAIEEVLEWFKYYNVWEGNRANGLMWGGKVLD